MTRPHLCAVLSPSPDQGYQWLKDKILSEEGRRQQAKLKELQAIAERLGCTLPQLAIGDRAGGGAGAGLGHVRSPDACAAASVSQSWVMGGPHPREEDGGLRALGPPLHTGALCQASPSDLPQHH